MWVMRIILFVWRGYGDVGRGMIIIVGVGIVVVRIVVAMKGRDVIGDFVQSWHLATNNNFGDHEFDHAGNMLK